MEEAYRTFCCDNRKLSHRLKRVESNDGEEYKKIYALKTKVEPGKSFLRAIKICRVRNDAYPPSCIETVKKLKLYCRKCSTQVK